GVRVSMPVSQVSEQGWSCGLSHQEAPQANGEEEAPQAAAEDARPAQEQEVARHRVLTCGGSCRRGWRGPGTAAAQLLAAPDGVTRPAPAGGGCAGEAM